MMLPLMNFRPQSMLAGSRNVGLIMIAGKPYMLQECSGSDVYCNALEGYPPLAEGSAAEGGPHAWPAPVMVDPNTVDPWLANIGGGIY
eukprot:CAMPEP_0184327854 /NCGR_PEP_ID=MMETSP1049-20130417/143313_1 /TAXON_ID=77928 /ORGANISM="Proteomonas sulcata, Strain CCMP704" /LENGTH=87 /DNA_ID=CAMNT_0026650131 /DNA_START=516 /DNA_END=779 /DNA_ORIENTATION=+